MTEHVETIKSRSPLMSSLKWLSIYFLTASWFSLVFLYNPLSVHGLPFFEWDRPTSYLYSHENYNLNGVSLIRSPVLFDLIGREQLGNGLSFRPLGVWKSENWEDLRQIDVEMALDPNHPISHQVYRSSFALHAAFWSQFAQLFDLQPDEFEARIRSATSIFSAMSLALIVVWLGVRLHWACVPVAFVITPMTVGFVLPAANMYSVLWAALLPLAVSLWAYRAPPAVHLSAVGAALLFFFLCTPAFASNIAGATAIPAVYFGLLVGHHWSRIAWDVLKYALVALIAFAISYAMLSLRIDGFLGGDGSGWTHLLSRAENWTVATALDGTQTEFGFLDGIVKIGAVTGLTFYGPFALPNAVVVVLGVGLLAWMMKTKMMECQLARKLRAWTLTSAFALLVSLSWVVIQFSHTAGHPRFAPFLLAYPWILCMIGVIGLLVALKSKARNVSRSV